MAVLTWTGSEKGGKRIIMVEARVRSWGRLAAILAGLLGLAWLAACAVNPVTGEQELVLMSEQQELAMGARYYPQTTQLNYGEVHRAPGLQAYVGGVGQRLALGSHRPGLPWEFNVVNTSQVNAFALPGGKISLTRGLLAKMSSEDEMASVLGHEVGHVDARHSVAQYTRGMLISLAVVGVSVALADSDYRQVGSLVAGVAGTLLMLSYSRDQERQADELGYAYMTAAGYNPEGQVRTFEMFKSLNNTEPGFIQAMLASHPLTSERIATARRRVEMADRRLVNQPLKVHPYMKAVAHIMDTAPAYAAMDKGAKAYGKKDYRAAENWYQKAIHLYPAEGLFHARLALAEVERGKVREAERHAQAGARLSRDVFYPNYVAGFVYIKAGDFERAADYLQTADSLMPSHAINKFMLAACYEKLGSPHQAVAAYRKVLQIAPKSQAGQAARARLNKLGVH